MACYPGKKPRATSNQAGGTLGRPLPLLISFELTTILALPEAIQSPLKAPSRSLTRITTSKTTHNNVALCSHYIQRFDLNFTCNTSLASTTQPSDTPHLIAVHVVKSAAHVAAAYKKYKQTDNAKALSAAILFRRTPAGHLIHKNRPNPTNSIKSPREENQSQTHYIHSTKNKQTQTPSHNKPLNT